MYTFLYRQSSRKYKILSIKRIFLYLEYIFLYYTAMTMKDELKKNRAQIKYWLEVHEMSRRELADKLQVTEAALNGWLSNKPLPPARWEEISELFSKYEKPVRNRIIGTSLSDSEYAKIQKAVEILGVSHEEFFREAILIQVKKDLGEE